jgi:peptide/nickel transport system substrate-binding protein
MEMRLAKLWRELLLATLILVPAWSQSGGRAIVVQRSEPRGFQPVYSVDEPSRAVIGLLHAPLLRIHSETQETEAVLAASWKVTPDGRAITVNLRENLRFSDGAPLTVADVLFTFAVHQDAAVASPLREVLQVGGKPLVVTAAGPRRVQFQMAEPYAAGERLLAGVAILPRHRMESAYQQGQFRSLWGLGAKPSELAGAGPFRLKLVEPGRRMVLERNPHYWKRDKAGKPLPYLDEMEFLFTAGEDAQVARLLAGEGDLAASFGGGSYRAIEAHRERRGIRLLDAGPSLDYTFLLFNLNPGGKRPWFAQTAFRQAVSAAMDRESIARLVYRGRASPIRGPVTPARLKWYAGPAAPAAEPRKLLSAAGYRWNGEGRLLDPAGTPVSFTLLVNAANPAYTQTGAIVEEDLKKIGIAVQVVPMEFRSLVDRVVNRKDYDAALMALRPGDVDPAADVNAWVSAGRTRLWNLSGQALHPWEASVDEKMRALMATRDQARRRRLFHEVQRILEQEAPMVCLVSPNLLLASRAGLENVRPGTIGDLVLWNADEWYWRRQ